MDLIGTLYVAPSGDAYRLNQTHDWQGKVKPGYIVLLYNGASTNRDELPAGSRKVFDPAKGHKVHFMAARFVQNTACNRYVSGTKYTPIVVHTADRSQVTCKRCKTAMDA